MRKKAATRPRRATAMARKEATRISSAIPTSRTAISSKVRAKARIRTVRGRAVAVIAIAPLATARRILPIGACRATTRIMTPARKPAR